MRNPSPIRRKVMQNLAEKLMATSLPAVGLKEIFEFIPKSFDKDMEPYYECKVSVCQAIQLNAEIWMQTRPVFRPDALLAIKIDRFNYKT